MQSTSLDRAGRSEAAAQPGVQTFKEILKHSPGMSASSNTNALGTVLASL